jgi:hypothetical protein
MADVGDDAEVPNLRRRGEGLVGETADGNLLVKPGLGASRVSADGRCSTIVGRRSRNETPGVILRGFVAVRELDRRDVQERQVGVEETGQIGNASVVERVKGARHGIGRQRSGEVACSEQVS